MFRQRITMKRVLMMMALLAAATPMLVHAGILDSLFSKGKAEVPDKARYDREPPLVFGAGALETDLMGNWSVGGCSLRFTKDSKVRIGPKTAGAQDLHMGQEARMMGYRLADGTVAVRSLTVVTMREQAGKLNALERIQAPVGEMPANTHQ